MPNRLLKETIRTSRSVNGLSDFQFRLWAYLITYVDDYGRGSADAELLKGFLFPRRKGVTEAQIRAGLHDLANAGMIHLYEVGGEPFLYFPNWSEHQRIRAKVPKFPEPTLDSNPPQVAAGCGEMQQTAADGGEMRPESNTIQSRIQNPIQNPESNPETVKLTFDEFWSAYPKKVAKQDAQKAFAKIGAKDAERIIPALERQKASREWQKDDGRYVPYPATWLNGRRWEDESPQKAQKADQSMDAMIAEFMEGEL